MKRSHCRSPLAATLHAWKAWLAVVASGCAAALCSCTSSGLDHYSPTRQEWLVTWLATQTPFHPDYTIKYFFTRSNPNTLMISADFHPHEISGGARGERPLTRYGRSLKAFTEAIETAEGTLADRSKDPGWEWLTINEVITYHDPISKARIPRVLSMRDLRVLERQYEKTESAHLSRRESADKE